MTRVRVLLVDDQALFREALATLLGTRDDLVVVGEAGNGDEALRRAAELAPDVVLMDLRMPVLDGRAALKALRETAGPNQDVPVLAFTADADVAGEGDLAGFDGLVRKPIQPLDMYSAIAGAIQWTATGHASEGEDAVDALG